MLFSDILVIVNEVNDKVRKKPVFVLSAVIPLDQCSIEEYLEQREPSIPKPRGCDPEKIFLIIQKGHSNPQIIVCDSQKDKVKWMADIIVQIEKHQKGSNT